MSAPKPMSAERLVCLRREAHGGDSGHWFDQLVRELLADRDYHYQRAEDAEAEAAQLLADLAEVTRERNELRLARAAAKGELVR